MGVRAISLGICTIRIGVFTSRTLAEKYQIYYLKNQIADILLGQWGKDILSAEDLD